MVKGSVFCYMAHLCLFWFLLGFPLMCLLPLKWSQGVIVVVAEQRGFPYFLLKLMLLLEVHTGSFAPAETLWNNIIPENVRLWVGNGTAHLILLLTRKMKNFIFSRLLLCLKFFLRSLHLINRHLNILRPDRKHGIGLWVDYFGFVHWFFTRRILYQHCTVRFLQY